MQTFSALATANAARSSTIDTTGKNPRQGVAGGIKLEQACRDFESVFVNYMLAQMRRTVPEDGLFGGGKGEELFTSMLDGELAKSVSNNQGLGLAAVLYQQLVELLPEE